MGVDELLPLFWSWRDPRTLNRLGRRYWPITEEDDLTPGHSHQRGDPSHSLHNMVTHNEALIYLEKEVAYGMWHVQTLRDCHPLIP